MIKKIFGCRITSIQLIVLTAVFWMAFANVSFFKAFLGDYPLNSENILFLGTATLGFTSVLIIVMCLFLIPRTIKPILITLLLSSSMAAYFMDTYNVLLDDAMIGNVFATDTREAADLLHIKMVLYLVLLGIIPALFVYKATIVFKPLLKEILSRLKLVGALLAIVLPLLYFQTAITASFFREHKHVRYYSNPANYVFGLGRHVRDLWREVKGNEPHVIIGEDAVINEVDADRELAIVVVGETARADRFSLNGYKRQTNPLLEKQRVVSFSDVTSCGTLTAISVPCMFSSDTAGDFDAGEAKNKDNALDILARAGVNVLWRDNNSSSKGVADRVEYQDFRSEKVNTICDEECRDVGMLEGLQDYIDAHPKGDILIVLHQMGNHGPAYYKRYPEAFEKFKPACKTNELSACSQEEIDNAYDNAVLYTDYFLNQVIEFLKKNDASFEASMLYISDHGESLGENNVYLHGIPNFMAPKEQRHVPMIMWVGSKFDELNFEDLAAQKNKPLSHDFIFHSLLGLMEVESSVYNKDLDFIRTK